MTTDLPNEDFERAFRVAFERSANPMVLVDDDRVYRAANPAFVELFGLGLDELNRDGPGGRIPEGWQESVDADWVTFLAQGAMTSHMALRTARGTAMRFDLHREANVLPGQHLAVMLLDPNPEEVSLADTPDTPAEPAELEGSLTSREAEVVSRVALGYGNGEIAAQLVISPETVRTHIRNAMAREGARTRAHLIAIAMRDGSIDLSDPG